MDDDFEKSLAEWHRAEAAASEAELAVSRLSGTIDDAASRDLRGSAAALRITADGLLAGLLRQAGSAPPKAGHG